MLKRVRKTRCTDHRKPAPFRIKPPRDSGAAMIEMAIAFGLLVTLLVGTVTAAIAFSQQNSIENAAREGSRFAATLPGPLTDPTWSTQVLTVTRAAGVGDLDATVPGQSICVAFIPGTGTPKAWREVGGVAQPVSSTPCYTDGLPAAEERIQVVTERDSEIQTVFFSVDLDLRGQAAARHERG